MASYDQAGYSLGGENPTLCTDKDIKQFMNHAYQYAYPANGAYWQQAYIDKRFVMGDQSLYSMLYGAEDAMKGRKLFFNLILRQRNMISGYQRRNRKSTTVLPNHDDDRLADDYSQVIKWSENRDNFHEFFSKAFEGCVDTGISYLHLYPDYTRDPFSGELKTDCVSYNSMLIDPYFTKNDLSDAQFVWRRRWVNKESARMLLPGDAEKIDKIRPTGAKDGRFPLQAELLNLSQSDLFAYDEFHYRSTRKATMIEDPRTGECVEWEKEFLTDEENERIKMWLNSQPWLRTRETRVPTVKLAIQISNQIVYNGPNLLNLDRYPFAPLICYHEPSMQSYSQRLMGVVRNARDAQYLYNRRKIIELDILESQVNSGWIYPVDAISDPKAFRQKGQGFLIPLKAGRSPQDIQRIEAPGIPESVLHLSQQLADDITQIIGSNEELLGSAEDDKAGILSMLRQSAGLTTLQNIFDNADFAQRIYGELRLEAIRKNWTKGKVQSILGRESDPMFFTTQAIKYSVEVEQGSYSATQKQTELKQKLYMREIGLPISDKSILKSATFSDKSDVLKEIDEQQQQQEQQQQMEQEQERLKAQREQETHQADMMKSFAEAKEKISRSENNQAGSYEKLSSANRQDAQASLDYVKELLALDDLDLSNLKKSLEIAQLIQDRAGHGRAEAAPTVEQAPMGASPPPEPGMAAGMQQELIGEPLQPMQVMQPPEMPVDLQPPQEGMQPPQEGMQPPEVDPVAAQQEQEVTPPFGEGV